MKMTVKSTQEIVTTPRGERARVWTGETEGGTPVAAVVTALGPAAGHQEAWDAEVKDDLLQTKRADELAHVELPTEATEPGHPWSGLGEDELRNTELRFVQPWLRDSPFMKYTVYRTGEPIERVLLWYCVDACHRMASHFKAWSESYVENSRALEALREEQGLYRKQSQVQHAEHQRAWEESLTKQREESLALQREGMALAREQMRYLRRHREDEEDWRGGES